ncbi:MAG TPA: S8 family serine peptidase [Pyrinomonadaceae bacterium]
MKKEKSKLIPFTRAEWKGKEVDIRTDRFNVKLNINRGKNDEKVLKRKGKEIVMLIEGASIKRFSADTGKLVLTVPEGTDILYWCAELSKRSDIAYAEPDTVTNVLTTPNDSRYGDQWALTMIDAENAWDLEKGNTDVLVAVLDTGISHDGTNLTHPDLNDTARYILGTDFVNDDNLPTDGHGHGTHVAGTIGAETDNSDGIAGLNWNSQIYVCKIFDDNGNGSESDFEAAVKEVVDFAIANSKRLVINLSAGWFVDNETLRDACEYAHDNGMVLCVATGNEGGALRTPAIHSANFSGVIAVGATNSADDVADFSNVGPAVSVVAPGEEILSTFPTYDVNGDTAHDFVEWDGTSMATPHVAGLASLVWSKESRLSNEQVRDVIQNTAVKLGSGDFNNNWGFGRINAAEAIAKAGWELTPVQTTLSFIDIPEGETQLRAIRIDVNSFHVTEFEVTVTPGAPFSLYNYSVPASLGKTTDYDTPRSIFIWVKYTGTTAGDIANSTAKVRCITTNEEFDITISANTVARPTCAMMLVLDKSGSMQWASGVGTMTREEVLKYSAGIFINYVHENNGLGIVTFDQDAYNLLNPVVGPFGLPDDPFDPSRSSALAAFGGYALNPSGSTAIGDGIEKGHNNLSGVAGYDKKAIIVFTDGHETDSKYIADVDDLINEQVFAVGLGTADQLNPAALDNICNNTGGYLLLTDSLDNDDTFKIAKYFLQIQAGVNNEQVVVDPTGFVYPGQKVKIPFKVNEADISIDTILMTTMRGILNFEVETPNGDIINASNLATYPTVMRSDGQMVSYYRLTMPVTNSLGINAQKGQWHIVLSVDKRYWKRYLATLRHSTNDLYTKLYQSAVSHGVKYTALVHAYSNLRMNCTKSQTSYEPGGTINIRAAITEYGVPLSKTASVRADLKMPDGTISSIVFNKVSDGMYEANVQANYNGIYTFTVKANGKTSRNVMYTREQVVTAAVWRGGDNPPPSRNNDPNSNPTQDVICKLIDCLSKASNKEMEEFLRKNGIDLKILTECYCKPRKYIR